MKTHENGLPFSVPDGLIHDWTGVVFIPGATFHETEALYPTMTIIRMSTNSISIAQDFFAATEMWPRFTCATKEEGYYGSSQYRAQRSVLLDRQ